MFLSRVHSMIDEALAKFQRDEELIITGVVSLKTWTDPEGLTVTAR